MDYLLIPKILFRDKNLKKMRCKTKVLYSFILSKFEKGLNKINIEALESEINTNDMTQSVILSSLKELEKFKVIKFSITGKILNIENLVIFN